MQMYKVFINEKKLSIGAIPLDGVKSIPYESSSTLEMALDMIENTSNQEVHVYTDNLEEAWENFSTLFKNVNAAGGIVHDKDGKILFIKRLGKWDLPKGKIEKGESTEQAAKREVEEETGIDGIEIEGFIHETYHIYREKNHNKVLKTTYWYKMSYHGTKNGTPQTEEGITEVDWKNVQGINTEVMSNTFKNIQLILKTLWKKFPQ